MRKKMAVPTSDCLVETESPLGTGIKAKMSIFLIIRRQRLVWSSVIKDDLSWVTCYVKMDIIQLIIDQIFNYF